MGDRRAVGTRVHQLATVPQSSAHSPDESDHPSRRRGVGVPGRSDARRADWFTLNLSWPACTGQPNWGDEAQVRTHAAGVARTPAGVAEAPRHDPVAMPLPRPALTPLSRLSDHGRRRGCSGARTGSSRREERSGLSGLGVRPIAERPHPARGGFTAEADLPDLGCLPRIGSTECLPHHGLFLHAGERLPGKASARALFAWRS
jgi:hypothetical protein